MTPRRKYRVVQWATGSVGASASRAVIEHPDLELVGLFVFDPAAPIEVDAGRIEAGTMGALRFAVSGYHAGR